MIGAESHLSQSVARRRFRDLRCDAVDETGEFTFGSQASETEA